MILLLSFALSRKSGRMKQVASTGKYVVYKLSDPRVDELLTLAEILLADVARGVYECTRYDLPKERNNG
jgi:hypothetical protein